MAVQDYKINYKSDFVLNINGDAGWAVPFCIKFWTGMPSQAYFVGFDGVKYVNCRVGDTPTQLMVMFDDHHLSIGKLMMQIAYHTTIEEFPGSVFDEVTNARDVIVTIDGTDYQVMLDFTGEDAPELEFDMPAYANEAERIQNELQRQQNEADRIAAELQREQATAAAVQGAENVNAQLAGNILTVTNRQGVSTSVNTKGEQGVPGPVGPEGPQGEQGVSIVDFRPVYASETATYYVITFSDGHEQSVAIPKGAKGDTGATGPTGPQGPQGQTGVSITGLVKTGETETDTLYNVTFSDGTTQAVAIPKGEKGDQGPQGPVGPQGPMGDVAVITPEQQAAFTMYSTTGQNTNGPMTQKAVTDALGNIAASGVSYDNSASGLALENVQGALDEVVENITNHEYIDLSNVPTGAFVLYSDKWHSSSDGFVKHINVIPNEKYEINTDATPVRWFIMDVMYPVNKTSVSYTTGTIPVASTKILTIPAGCYYLVFQDETGLGNPYTMPSSVYHVGDIEDVVDSNIEPIRNAIEASETLATYRNGDCVNTKKIMKVNGDLYSLTGYNSSNYIQIPQGSTDLIYSGIYGNNHDVYCGIVIADSNQKVLWFNPLNLSEQNGQIRLSDYPTATQIRFCCPNGNISSISFVKKSLADMSQIGGNDTLRTYGSTNLTGTISGYSAMYYCSLDTPCLEKGIIQTIQGKWASSGTVKLYIGFIDQNNYLIIRDSFTIAVTSGVYTANIASRNIIIYENEYVFFSGQDTTVKPYFKVDTSVSPKGTNTASDMSYHVRTDGVFWCFGWTVKSHSLSFNEIADSVDDMQNEINTNAANIEKLQNNRSYFVDDTATGMTYQLTVRNGAISLIPMQFSNALVLGNSITLHGISQNVWWGLWGMAATKPEYDFVHVVEEGLKVKDANAICNCLNIAVWEQNFSTDLATLIGNNLTSNTDLVVIRLGENVPSANVPNFAAALGNLIDYIYSVTPNAKVVITGVFWVNSAKETAIITAAEAKGIDYIRLDQLDNNSYKEAIGHYVYGDDNAIHEITNSGVANHPNNRGMAAIANIILNTLGYDRVQKNYILQEVTVGGVTGTMWVLNE